MSDDMRIQKIAVEAMIELHDRETLNGKLFLAPLTERHHGREQILDLLTQPDPFLPVRLADGGSKLVSKGAIVRVRVDRAFGMKELDPDGLLAQSGHLTPVMICLTTGEVISGSLPLMPEGRRTPRLLDWLRTVGRFLPLIQEDAVVYIAIEATTWIEETSGS